MGMVKSCEKTLLCRERQAGGVDWAHVAALVFVFRIAFQREWLR